jgi:PspAB-like protein
MEQEIKRFLVSLNPEFDLTFRSITDTYGYMWIVLEGKRIEDLLAGLTAVGDTIAEKGFSDQILAAVFEFYSERQGIGYQYLIYNYKRNKFYSFVPIGQQDRNTEQEMQIMATIGDEVPFEKDMTLWYPLWNLPFRPQV